MKKVMAAVLIDKDNCISFWERNNIPHFLVIPFSNYHSPNYFRLPLTLLVLVYFNN